MKVSLTKLEELRRDPLAFKTTPSVEFKGGYGMFQALQHAALRYSKSKDCPEAKKYLRKQFEKNFDSIRAKKTLLSYFAQLDEYAMRFEERKFRYKKSYYNISLDLPPHFPSTVSCTGQIPLLSFKAALSQWDVLFYSQNKIISTDELRLPLIQGQIANQMQAELEDVSVSFYHFASGEFTSFQFSQNQVKDAQIELENLLAQIV